MPRALTSVAISSLMYPLLKRSRVVERSFCSLSLCMVSLSILTRSIAFFTRSARTFVRTKTKILLSLFSSTKRSKKARLSSISIKATLCSIFFATGFFGETCILIGLLTRE